MPAMLFTRDFRGLTGGHLKLADYLRHVRDDGRFSPLVYLTPESDRPAFAALLPEGVAIVDAPFRADAHFLAGLDWAILRKHDVDPRGRPAINLLQGFRHVDPAHPCHAFLDRPALRVCVSAGLRDAVAATGRTNGPLVTIRNGIDLAGLASIADRTPREAKVFIGGLKRPDLAARLAGALASSGIAVDLATGPVSRAAFLSRIAAAMVAVVLPLPVEGFFLPALEAMALGAAVVTLDCRGSRDFCRDGETALIPDPDVESLAMAVRRLLESGSVRRLLVTAAKAEAAAFSLQREAAAFRQALTTYLASEADRSANSR